jgi:large subunit ribosomal protein L2
MAVRKRKPTSAGRRFQSVSDFSEITKDRPERTLVEPLPSSGGRNSYGRMTSRHRGGAHKRQYRVIDFWREKDGVPARVAAIEYDPNRNAHIALLHYTNGEKRYIIAPDGLKAGDRIFASANATTNDFTVGNSFPLSIIPPSTRVHCVEMIPGKGAQMARSAGTGIELVAVENGNAQLKMPSGEIRMVNARCRATIGIVGNGDHVNQSLGKAGRNRWLGRRPRVRGMAMNPVDHPNGGGQGKSKGGGGRQQVVSPWGQLAKGFPTRRRRQQSSSFIIVRHNGRPPRGKK